MSTTATLSRRTSLAFGLSPLVLVALASALAWGVLCVAFAPVQQNFPLNDDWAFGQGAMLFARGQGIHYFGWASMPQLGQWLWACPFLWVLGESYFALRVSTVMLSWVGLAAFYDLLRQEGVTPRRAALATAALAFNPLFFLLQGTFMTDVPALSLALAALALYGRGVRDGGAGWLASACLVAILAVLTRQNTLAVPLTAAVLLWRQRHLRTNVLGWLAVSLPLVAAVAVHLWLQQRPDVRAQKPELIEPPALLQLPFVAIHFCGLAALPVLLLAPRVVPWKRFAIIAGLMLACGGYWLLYGPYLPYGGLFPYTDNMLTPFGAFAGSRLSGGLLVAGDRPLLLGTGGRVFLSLLGCVAGAALVARGIQRGAQEWIVRPLLLFSLLQVPFLLIIPEIYDRYLLFLLPGALALAAGPTGEADERVERRFALAGLACAIVFGVVSVGLMHDWLAWNAARWELGRRAVERGHINPLDIEGGVEWDGAWAIRADASPRRGPRWPVLSFTENWFPLTSGHYILSFSELRGTRRVDTEPYALWLSPGARRFFLLEQPPLPAARREERGPATTR
jgi:4-amino-4-deoxy-L-arabinose transferase-like glycosyltransferase